MKQCYYRNIGNISLSPAMVSKTFVSFPVVFLRIPLFGECALPKLVLLRAEILEKIIQVRKRNDLHYSVLTSSDARLSFQLNVRKCGATIHTISLPVH